MENKISNSLTQLLPDNLDIFNPQNRQIFDLSTFSLKQTNINSRECPHCGSHQIHSNGNYKGRKRYRCQDCNKSYNDFTKTSFSGIHDLNKIMKYFTCMINGDTIRRAAELVDISVPTSFSWRHRILNGLKKLPSPNLKNVKEVMELELPYSYKGQRTMPTVTQKKSKVSAVFVCDRTGKLDSDSIVSTQRENNPIFARISEKNNIHTDIICPTNFFNFIDPSHAKFKIPNSYYSQPTIVPHIVSLWKTWMKRFRGVASKYLSNYLHWFDYLDNSLLNPDKIYGLIQLLFKH